MRAPAVLQQRCPDLRLSMNHTTTGALHLTSFVGTLEHWSDFKTDVLNAMRSARLHQSRYILDYRGAGLPGQANLKHEHVYCGDETGVQGRWQANVGAAVSAAFKACDENMAYADYKASAGVPALQGKVPDLVLLDTVTRSLLFSGEVKTPWVPAHNLANGLLEERRLRRLLGELGLVSVLSSATMS